jgi:hypothetical protein
LEDADHSRFAFPVFLTRSACERTAPPSWVTVNLREDVEVTVMGDLTCALERRNCGIRRERTTKARGLTLVK